MILRIGNIPVYQGQQIYWFFSGSKKKFKNK